jgi:hypothetical protein
MNRFKVFFLFSVFLGPFSPFSGYCQEMSPEEIEKELKTFKSRINALDQELSRKKEDLDKIKEEYLTRDEIPGLLPEITEQIAAENAALSFLKEYVQFNGLIEFGGVWAINDEGKGGHVSEKDLGIPAAELMLQARLNQWVDAGMFLLYRKPTFAAAVQESGLDLDVGVVTIGNTNKFPVYFTGGIFYLPFGGLLTHIPDNPLVDQPLTMALGEMREEAVLLGIAYQGLSLSGYVFKSEINEFGDDSLTGNFGFNAKCEFGQKKGLAGIIGASYISNLADSEGLREKLGAKGISRVKNRIPGCDVYCSLHYGKYSLDMEYMTSLRSFAPNEIETWQRDGARPSVWNIEFGYNFNWGKNLEIVLKYSGSNQAEGLGYPERRLGINFNQSIFEGVVGSLGYFNDQFGDHDIKGREGRHMVFGQIAVEF